MTSRFSWGAVVTLVLLSGCLTPSKLAKYRDELLSKGLAVDSMPCRQPDCLRRKSSCLKTLAESQAAVEAANRELQKLESLWSMPRSAPLADKVKQSLTSCEGLS